MKITFLKEKNNLPTIVGVSIPVGTVFKGKLSSLHKDRVYLRCYDILIALDDPVCTWPIETIKIFDYEVLDVELLVK